ncbi:protein NPAT-like isoform X2 [Ctenocephalides felis]|uniref:protein NPAT-like isoform X2 n=1 Tax=Ctenocephalides felis TaxID=7515 RepID=UPI000E6E22F5|nr:protein NPAT-like isoform X2 [Ctenocephalides felis]
MVLLPSEKARLVLGYLREQECYRAYKEFLISSPHLKELRGMIRKGAQPHEYEWKMRGLSNILDEYSSVECSICALQNSDVSKFFGDANTIAKKVQRLVEILQKQSAALSTSSKRDIKEFNNESHKPSHSTKNINKLKSVEGPNLPNTSLIVQDGIPIISNIPESVMSDESSDLCSLAFSPVKNDKTVIGNDNDRNISNLTMGNLDSFVRGNACRRIKMKNDSKKQAIRNNSKSKIEKTATGCTNEGFDMTLMTETILERTDIHEKIAENINKLYLSSMTKNEEKNSKTSETPSKVVENVNEKISDMEIVDLETHLNNVIRDIVNATEKDHVFDELLNDLVLKVAEEAPSSTSSEDTSPGRPTTSTPEHASGKSKIAVLNTTTSPVRTATESCKSTNKDDQESEKNNKNTTDDSIKNRLRSKLKVDNEDITNNTKSSSSTSTVMEVDKTPLKSSKPIDLLAMAINDADVSGSLRKMNVSNSKNDNKIVILSNEVVHRNLSDFNIANTCNSTVIQTKPANTLNFESTNSMNTHYILPAVNTNNMFLNTNMPQYLVTGNTDDQNKVYLINTPLSLPIQNNGNNESNDVMAVPTFIVLPQSAPVTSAVKDNSTIGYQQVL